MAKNNYSFPFGIYCGELIDKDNNHIPFLLPEESGGFCVLFENSKEKVTHTFIENVVLNLLNITDINSLEINIFDYNHRPSFSYLSDLEQNGIYKIHYNTQLANKNFSQLADISRERYHKLLSRKNSTLIEYNKNNEYKEKYYLMILNLDDFPDEYTSDKDFIGFLSDAHDAGIYTIAFGSLNTKETKKKAIKFILDEYPIIEIIDDKVEIKNHKNTQSVLKLIERYDCSINLLDENRDDLTDDILEKFEENIVDDLEEDFLTIPIGFSPDGRNKINFVLGERSGSHQTFITGIPGSGKTTLLNNIIVDIAQKYTSKEVDLYLMDYKKGTEFKLFKNHPNCRKIFLNNKDLQAATNLLEDFVNLMEERSTLFGDDIKDITQYNKENPNNIIPRSILIIDEVQRLFIGDYKVTSHFSELLKEIVTQGRSFGIHMILSTQSLAGTNIDKSLMKQITLRISYKLNESQDSDAIFGYGNETPIKLKKYELIYNSNAGNKDSNILCRVYKPKNVKSIINEIRENRDESLCLTPEVFENKGTKVIPTKTEMLPQKEWKFTKSNNTNKTYGTSKEEEFLQSLAKKGIAPQKVDNIDG